MPEPNSNESKSDWMKRCMGDSEQNKTFPDQSQRYAVCESKWKESKTSKLRALMKKLFKI